MIDPETNHLILFGGYGRHTYNADFVEKGLNDGDQWQIISLDSCITPRYLSAMGIEDKDHILIMGGINHVLKCGLFLMKASILRLVIQ